MPELPEVQTVVNSLQSIIGDIIIDFWSDWERALQNENGKKISQKVFAEEIVGKKIISIERFGKSILINLSDNLSLFAHLRMTGQLLIKKHVENKSKEQKELADVDKYSKHIHHIFYLQKNGMLAFSDIRKFATLKLIQTTEIENLKSKTGIDPFEKAFSLTNFTEILNRRKNKSIKENLLDQSLICGIGNIYASEILFDAKIKPDRKTNTLSIQELKVLHLSIKKILKKAIKFRGTSFSDYRDSAGQKGAFQNMLMVYKKNKQKCKVCGTIIERSVIGQRSTFFCSKCQK